MFSLSSAQNVIQTERFDAIYITIKHDILITYYRLTSKIFRKQLRYIIYLFRVVYFQIVWDLYEYLNV